MGTANEIGGDGIRSLWKDLFHGFDQKLPVSVQLIDDSPKPRSLSVSLMEDEEVSLPIEGYEAGSIEFTWSDSSGVYKSRPVVGENGRITFPSVRNINVTAFFPAQFRLNPEETAKRLSDLNKNDELGDMVALIHEVYPDVISASVEHNAGSWQTFVKLDGMKSTIPIGSPSASSKSVSRRSSIAPARPPLFQSGHSRQSRPRPTRLQHPSVETGQRVSALRFGDPRVMAVFKALTALCICPEAFETASSDHRWPPYSVASYMPALMTYNLRRLRLKGLIHRISETPRYTATTYGLKVAFFYTTARSICGFSDRIGRPPARGRCLTSVASRRVGPLRCRNSKLDDEAALAA
jgi:hypothetical protein